MMETGIIIFVFCVSLMIFILKDIRRFLHKNVRDGQIIVRVYDAESLAMTEAGFVSWDVEYTDNPEVIGKIFEYLRTALVIRLYITKSCIQYVAETVERGQVSGSCHRGYYGFFEFGLRKSGHRFDIYGEDRNNPTIKVFYDWWGNLVRPYEEEFDKDFNL